MSTATATMNADPRPARNPEPRRRNGAGPADGPLTRLVEEIGRAAAAGWSQTVRLAVLLTAAALAIALIIAATR
ncbi:MAG: hypothetical protein ACRDNW_13375 [Trebonia sp.]